MTCAVQISEHTVGGIRWLERPGPGPVIVLLHGIGSNAESFRGVLEGLPARFRGLAWHAPGYCGSAPLEQDWPIAADYAAALHAGLLSLGITQAIVVGHSLGTLIGSAFARTWPQAVQQLVLVSSACGYGIEPGAVLPEAVAARILDLQKLGAAEFAKTRAARLVFEPEANIDLVAIVEQAMACVDESTYAQAVRMLASGTLEANLANLAVPCSFIIGTKDKVTPVEQTERAASSANAGRMHTAAPIEYIADAGHAVYLQKPVAFMATLLRLISADEIKRNAN